MDDSYATSPRTQHHASTHKIHGTRRCNLWDKLPLELAEKVFAYLPVPTVLQCRSVCKRWHQILSSRTFLELWSRLSPPVSWFLVYNNSRGFAAFNPSSSKWINIPIFDRCSVDLNHVVLMASSGGLLCFQTRNCEQTDLIVCNPVTNCVRLLPSMHQIRYIDILGMIVDKTTNRYKILATGSIESSIHNSITEVYDSITGCWDHHCRSTQEFLQFWCKVRAVWCSGSFYCLTMPTSSWGFRLLVHNMSQKKWYDLGVEMPSTSLQCPSLVSCQGRLLLAGKIVVDRSMKKVCIWELNTTTYRWKEIASMPKSILLKVEMPHFLGMQSYGNSNMICFSGHRSRQSVIYDMLLKTWHWMPEGLAFKSCTGRNDYSRNSLVGMLYEPDFLANV